MRRWRSIRGASSREAREHHNSQLQVALNLPGHTPPPTRVRWRIIALLTGFSIVSYIERMNISIAAKFMMPALNLSQIQMGQVFSSFLIGYTLFQIPTGIWGDRRGPKLVLTLAGLTWGIATVLTGIVPGIVTRVGLAAFASLLLLRFLLGVGEAATYPVAARAIANWTPLSERARANGILVGGLSAGSAVTPPIVSWLMVRIGWRQSFYVISVFAFLISALWNWYGASSPGQHPRVNASEAALINAGRDPETKASSYSLAWWRVIFLERDIALISLSYFFSCYVLYIFVFWLYTYLVDVRGFSVLSGGIWTSLPFVASTLLTPTGGVISDKLVKKLGRTWARRIIALTGLGLAGCFLAVGAIVKNPYLAIAGLSLAVGFDQFAEPAFWAGTIDVAGPLAGTACGVLNMMGNLGGVVSTALVPVLVKAFGWTIALGTGSALAVLGALLWFGVRAEPLQLSDFVHAPQTAHPA